MQESSTTATDHENVLSFDEMDLDERLVMAIYELGWLEPTPIQETAIPLIMQGKDVLAKARTGSGKTAAYAIPLLQKLLILKKSSACKQSTFVLVITPSRELCSQAYKNLLELSAHCRRELNIIDLANDEAAVSSNIHLKAQRQMLYSRPDVVVSTPTKILRHLSEDERLASEFKSTLELLVIDEADLLLSFGYEQEMRQLIK
jgi:ATP-dependent RNA helicase DDX56/DBP9